ncbi:glycosyltransferase family 4 protein [Thermodesulfovibrio sp. 3907-1M]|uniref:Glycosyltransferase family 4 protein n=1 Tax=Thermodesulfovibrio autotrophicus TaxID=3118333 RepID=A0AAU8GVN8_9BACT
MKILFYNVTTTIKHGGIESFCLGLAKNLAISGWDVTVCGGFPINIELPDNLNFLTFPFIPRKKFPDFGSRFRKFMERLSFAYAALPTLKKNRYDFFCIFKPYDLPVALFIKKMNKCKIIFFSGGTEFYPGYGYFVKKLDYFFSCSNFNASQIEKYCNIKPVVLPNGIDTQVFKPLQPDLEIKNSLGIKNEKVIISVCRLVGWKGIQYSIKAVNKAIKEGYNVKYLIIGEGEYRKNLERLVNSLKINNKVIFLGNKSNFELPRYYSIADIAIFPSVADETFGISIAEAMACGIPVISTTVGGIPEVIGDTGFLVPPCDKNAILDKIKLLINNENLRIELGSKGRQRVVQNFSWDIVIKKFWRHLYA